MNLTSKQLFGMLTEEQRAELNEMAFEKLKEAVETLPKGKLHNIIFSELKHGIDRIDYPDLSFLTTGVEDALQAPIKAYVKELKNKLK